MSLGATVVVLAVVLRRRRRRTLDAAPDGAA
jgi:hypothetical protein